MKKMFKAKQLNAVLVFTLLLSLTVPTLAQAGNSVASTMTVPRPVYSAALAAIEEKAEARRKELGIPGMSLAIVKDDQVIFAKGFGYKDFEHKVSATADTQFAIGSATKAFTALSVLMTADEGKISLTASPKTVLPYFKMYDPDTDKNMTILDLMTHSSGLNRTDIAMITGKLTRAELIRVDSKTARKIRLSEPYVRSGGRGCGRCAKRAVGKVCSRAHLQAARDDEQQYVHSRDGKGKGPFARLHL